VVPSKPTSSSSPSRGFNAPKRSGARLPQPAIRTMTSAAATRRPRGSLAATDGVDQPSHALGIDGFAHVAVALERGADDQRIGEREQIGRRLRRDAAADEDRHVRHRAAHALDVVDRRGVAGGAAGDDETVGERA